MNMSFAMMRLTLIMLFFSQISFGMELDTKLAEFTCFEKLGTEMQLAVMNKSDNQANIQRTNQYWSGVKSIQSQDAHFSSLSYERLLRVLFKAVYVRNYDGVKNICKRSDIVKRSANQCPLYCLNNNGYDGKILDLYTVASDDQDDSNTLMAQLLEQCGVNKSCLKEETRMFIRPTELIMHCFLGNSLGLVSHYNEPVATVQDAFLIAVDCDHGKCLQKLIDDLYFDSNLDDIVKNSARRRLFLTKDLLEYACENKKLNALRRLLATKHFNLNAIKNEQTLLDTILELAITDPEYYNVAKLLQQYGAQTTYDVIQDQDDQEDIMRRASSIAACTIF